MIKYIILSAITYYVFTNYLAPLIPSNKSIKNDDPPKKKSKEADDEYIDYEEIK